MLIMRPALTVFKGAEEQTLSLEASRGNSWQNKVKILGLQSIPLTSWGRAGDLFILHFAGFDPF